MSLIDRQAAIDALDEIRHALWKIDIPSPTVPEYVEHHEQVQSVWKLLDKKQKELYAMPSAQSEREKGKWVHLGGDEWCCPACGFVISTEGSWEHPLETGNNFCKNCGADMRGEEDE